MELETWISEIETSISIETQLVIVLNIKEQLQKYQV